MPDLWSIPPDQLQLAARRLCGQQARALPLTSGLWVSVETPQGRTSLGEEAVHKALAPPQLVSVIARARHAGADGKRCTGAVSALLPLRPWLPNADAAIIPERWRRSDRHQAWVWQGDCPACGKPCTLLGVAVRGRYVSEKQCDGRCMGAKGPTCECSCGGKNHGAAYR